MSHYLIAQIERTPGIRVRTCSEVVGVAGDDHLESITLRDNTSGTQETVDAAFLFLFIGAAPRTDWLDGLIARDRHGFILSGPDLVDDTTVTGGWPLERMPHHLETSVPGVYAAGDVRSQSAKRVASAVGEGAMAVMLVHRYLGQL